MFRNEDCNDFLRLKEEIVYLEQCKVCIYDVWYPVPRKMAFYGEEGLKYTFANNTFTAKKPVPIVKKYEDYANSLIQMEKELNFCVVNEYRDGLDKTGLHKDNERDLNSLYPIVSFSFGATRDIIFKRKGFENVSIPLENGSVLIMYPPTTDYWYHEIPIRKRVKEPRISLTFRRIENKKESD
ncbi:hypothetical protein TNCT_338921 [Trichonephila clavata]|uniref:Fe2OG dioxygenase domain-containing protein n=1 Tax=Trichonephila clavata TaxID=2740835 RepID=A0A8X6J768_TRICU|nr:hypothetical protein TNCT_448101 [Trichonephila clavata]GFQ94710.1 hypothetical protein TNCT_338921 [Trichonephila clavata]